VETNEKRMKKTESDYLQELMEVVEPFLQHYQQYPIGFAETDKLNDIEECKNIVQGLLNDFRMCTSSEKRRIIQREIERFNDGKNAGPYGRYMARLLYLKSLLEQQSN